MSSSPQTQRGGAASGGPSHHTPAATTRSASLPFRVCDERVVLGIGIWWPVKREPKGCPCCSRGLFIGGHVHPDGTPG